ncbi:hypothetical protein [Azospirillum soli]|uniref:hypothetical protein n=1 Tax=Azospirillum soli TaxID=1304799 RepID=UPI001AE29B49|nr:hypothetical protein [Azospirillum soli]MBP2311872.1 hypothetical protein [Azospirillum soli]
MKTDDHDTRRPQPQRKPLDPLRGLLLGTAAPFAGAYAAYHAETARIGKMTDLPGDEFGALVNAKDEAFTSVVRSPDSLCTIADAIAAVGFLRDYITGDETATLVDIRFPPAIADALWSFLARVHESAKATEGSTIIPELGMTFTEAADRRSALYAAVKDISDDEAGDDEVDKLCEEENRIIHAIAAIQPQTVADCLAVLQLVGDKDTALQHSDVHAPGTMAAALFHATLSAAAVLSSMPAGMVGHGSDAELVSLYNRLIEAESTLNSRAPGTSDEELEPFVAAFRDADSAFRKAPARSVAGIALKLRRFWDLCEEDPSIAPQAEDVIDLLKTANEAAERLSAMPAGMLPAAHADAELLDLWHQYMDLSRRWDAMAKTSASDEEMEPLGKAIDRIDDRMTELPALTMAGVAVKMKRLMIRYTEAPWAVDMTFGDMPEPHTDMDSRDWMIWKAIQDAERLAQQPQASASSLTAIYTRWREAQARYNDPNLPDDQDEATKELDEIERRLALEPVQCATDVFVKLAALLSELHTVGVPVIDAEHKEAWPRLLPITEAAADMLPPDVRGPFKDMMAGIRMTIAAMDEADAKGRLHTPARSTQPADTFADTIAAFEAEAAQALSLPSTPTLAMVEAGAAAAGIDIEQARAIYAAMAEAYKKEAA